MAMVESAKILRKHLNPFVQYTELGPSLHSALRSTDGFGSDPSSLHKYTYCGNNPANAFDPSGNLTLTETVISTTLWGVARTIFGAAIGAASGGIAGGYDAIYHGQITDQEIAAAMTSGFVQGARVGGLVGLLGGFGTAGRAVVGGIGIYFTHQGIAAADADYEQGNVIGGTYRLGLSTVTGIFTAFDLVGTLNESYVKNSRTTFAPRRSAPPVRGTQLAPTARVVRMARPRSNGKVPAKEFHLRESDFRNTPWSATEANPGKGLSVNLNGPDANLQGVAYYSNVSTIESISGGKLKVVQWPEPGNPTHSLIVPSEPMPRTTFELLVKQLEASGAWAK